MSHIDKVMEIFNRLKIDMEKNGLVISNEKGNSNLMILALSEAFTHGIEIGEISGKVKTVEEIERRLEGIL
jgi:hypothetical protein